MLRGQLVDEVEELKSAPWRDIVATGSTQARPFVSGAVLLCYAQM